MAAAQQSTYLLGQRFKVLCATAMRSVQANGLTHAKGLGQLDVVTNARQTPLSAEFIDHLARGIAVLANMLGEHGRQKTQEFERPVLFGHDGKQCPHQLAQPVKGVLVPIPMVAR